MGRVPRKFFMVRPPRPLMSGKKCECPTCFFEFELEDDVIAGEVVTCPDCSADLEVVSVSSDAVQVEPAGASEEDWGE